MTRRQVKTWSRQRIEEIKSAGIKYVKVIGSGNIGDECEACIAAKQQSFEIEFAPELPPPSCDLKWCKCVIVASES